MVGVARGFGPSSCWVFVVKGGVEERDPDRYDVSVAAFGQRNPLMPQVQPGVRIATAYGELLANVAVGSLPLSLSANVHYGDDSYLQSDLGLVSGHLDRDYGVDLNWTVNEKIAAYATLGREKMDSRTVGSSTFTVAEVEDDFETYGAASTRSSPTRSASTSTTPTVTASPRREHRGHRRR